MDGYKQIKKAAEYIEKNCGRADIAIVLGSGLGDYAACVKDEREIAYKEIPGFPETTVKGHAGKFVLGTLQGKRVLLMNGRFHSYEGLGMEQIAMPVRVMRLLGVQKLILTNAAGGVNLDFKSGDLMLLTDFINLTGKNPLRGENYDEFGPRFPDMTYAYSPALRKTALECAAQLGITLRQGVYCWMPGPSYETPAEIRMVRTLGADAVGMSTVPETIVARHCGMEVLGLSCITNMAAGILDRPLSHEEVMEAGEKVQKTFRALLDAIVAAI
jgi:purine-nucleoside phosphorylase